jgi:hypothetical protein
MTYPSITLTGNIFTFDTLEKIANFDEAKQAPADYGMSSRDELRDQILFEWAIFKERYKNFSSKLEKTEAEKITGLTRKQVVEPLLNALGYQLKYDNSAELIEERSYVLSHRAVNLDGMPFTIIGAHQSLDKKGENMRCSPHALVQEYLNYTEHIYAIISDGKHLRVLRDSSILTKLSYLEFNLDKMVEDDLFADFALMYLIIHSSRMPATMGAESALETYHQNGLESGSRIRENLSIAVERAILHLGDGLLKDHRNIVLQEWVVKHGAQEYYGTLLKLVYRLLFLMVIEERELIFKEPEEKDSDEAKLYLKNRALYQSSYSVARHRKLCDFRNRLNVNNIDLWENLKNTFQLFEPRNIGTKIGIAPLGGDLFSTRAMAILYETTMSNGLLLSIVASLHEFTNKQGQLIAINYKSLDVEEFGSVYEGLLEKKPTIIYAGNTMGFTFVSGNERSKSGSHYTPDELVQPLIKHSLEHLISDILHDKSKNTEAKIKALLKLKVADVACGSGHILLAAARRIGLELARLHTGEEQPAPPAVRMGVREAIRNCIYGVDLNPYAVELCKVALWLEAHVPGEPLNFLDSKIKCGNAIVGLAHFEELENGIADEAFKKLYDDEDSVMIRTLKNENKKGQRGWETIKKAKHLLIDNYKLKTGDLETILSLPETTIAEVEKKQVEYVKYFSGPDYLRLRSLADLQIAPFFIKKIEDNKYRLITTYQYALMLSGQISMQNQAAASALGLSYEKKLFHWFLEFPEVFAQGGFDCVLGNPPFKGGQKLSGEYGKDFAEFIKVYFDPIGSVDLVTYFFRRIYSIIKQGGFQSLISTNTIAQGDARTGGLEVITEHQGGSINHAIRSMKWPGLAAVEVALVTLHKGAWTKPYILDGKSTSKINTYLDDQEYLGNPYKLKQNANKSFQGSIVLGKGFILEPEEAQRLIDLDPKNAEVIFPYLNGEDLNNEVDQKPTRWVINFFDWPEEKAMEYSEPYNILLRKVKPERMRWKEDSKGNPIVGEYALRKPLPEKWWIYGEKRPALYLTIKNMERVLVVARISKTVAFEFKSSHSVFADALVVFPYDKYRVFLLMQSSLNNLWAWNYCTTMKSDLNYSPSQTFETFPFPQLISQDQENQLEQIGETYHEYRKQLMQDVQLGLTKLYNCFHDSKIVNGEGLTVNGKEKLSENNYLKKHLKKTPDTISLEEAINKIVHLRSLHKKMDEAVLEAYGWHIPSKRWGSAIDLRHDFYEVDYLPENDRVRYTIHPDARKEVLKRLLLLNHEVHESETRKISYAELDKEKTIALMQNHFNKEWSIDATYLQAGTLRFLTTAEELLPHLHKSTAQIYNAVIQSYGSAIESELQEKLFIPFTTSMHKKYNADDLKDLTFGEKDIREVSYTSNKLFRNQTDYTLGQIHYLLSLLDDSKSPLLKRSIILQELRDFFFSVYKRSIVQDHFLSMLKSFIDTYRNEAAHTGQMSKADAETCRKAVMGIVGELVSGEY